MGVKRSQKTTWGNSAVVRPPRLTVEAQAPGWAPDGLLLRVGVYRHIKPLLCWGSKPASKGLQTTGLLGSGAVSTRASLLISNCSEHAKCPDRGGHIWGCSWDQWDFGQ